MGARVAQALDNLEAVLGEAGFALDDVVRMNYFVTYVDVPRRWITARYDGTRYSCWLRGRRPMC